MVYHVKGGIWKNTEDEILKAAVMKYGLNQWARISSLLVRKSASQCKARWYEWLDPSIKKTDWSREEEEKLLHLAKLLPNQWRTIAPLVGRTANQCLEHYDKLLDAAQQKDESYDPSDDPRRPRPGEIDPNPETKPARPDPIDMDEDEKEMLQEARARLANTKGKKAKRKAREKQLEEARRIAALQKRRELKAAGIHVSNKPKKNQKGIDYGREIPFYQDAPLGFFEPEPDKAPKPFQFRPITREKLEGKRKIDEELKLRQRDAKRQKLAEEKNLPSHIMQINKLNDPQQIRKSAPLQLPNPQLSDRELEELARLQKTSQSAEDSQEDTATSSLLSNYSVQATPVQRAAQIRTPARPDTVMMEAANLVALSHSQTPLVGGQNQQLHQSDFSGATPRNRPAATPNVLLTPVPNKTPGKPSNTPQTPMRDQLNINKSLPGASSLELVPKNKPNANSLDSLFANLPAPKNSYSVMLPEEEQETVMDVDSGPSTVGQLMASSSQASVVPDSSDLDALAAQKKAKQEELRYLQSSQVHQRKLPRANLLGGSIAKSESPADMIAQELRNLLLADEEQFPSESGFRDVNPTKLPRADFEPLPLEARAEASKLIEEELSQVLQERNLSEEDLLKNANDAWDKVHCRDTFVFSPEQKTFVKTDSLSKEQQVTALKSYYEMVRSRVSKESERAKKLEKKISLYNGGYQTRATTLQNDLVQLYIDLELAETELSCFRRLHQQETYSIQARLNSLQLDLDTQTQRESELQQRYATNLTKLRALQAAR